MVFAILHLAEYPKDMHCRILSGFIPPPSSEIVKCYITIDDIYYQPLIQVCLKLHVYAIFFF